MWIPKGILLGTAFSFIATVIYLLIYLPLKPGRAIALSAIRGLTVQSPLYWVAFVVVLALACILMRVWQRK